jgi:hypothetical protein
MGMIREVESQIYEWKGIRSSKVYFPHHKSFDSKRFVNLSTDTVRLVWASRPHASV